MSTISVVLSRPLTEAHAEKQQHFIAAPVLGRPTPPRPPSCSSSPPAPLDQIERRRPLRCAGPKDVRPGQDPPAANVVKLIGNFLITTVIESLAEAMALVRKFKLDGPAFLDFLTGSLFAAPVYRTYGSMIAAGKFEPVGFKMPLGFKDNRLLLAAAEEAGVPMPLASLVHDRFVAALAQGLAEADWSAIARISYQGGLGRTGQVTPPGSDLLTSSGCTRPGWTLWTGWTRWTEWSGRGGGGHGIWNGSILAFSTAACRPVRPAAS